MKGTRVLDLCFSNFSIGEALKVNKRGTYASRKARAGVERPALSLVSFQLLKLPTLVFNLWEFST